MKRSESTRLASWQDIIEKRRMKESTGSLKEQSRASSPTMNGDLSKLQDDLWLASSVGQALLEENEDLKERLGASETARDTLLDRLAASYRDNAAIERRLERQQANADTAEAANRALMATLEEDRKAINRLSSEAARASGQEKKLRTLTRERDDLRQELEMQIRKATAAENRAKRATQRFDQIDAIATPELQDSGCSPEIPTSQALGERLRSPARVSAKKPKLRHSDSVIFRHVQAVSVATEPTELLNLVETLVDQNAELKTELSEAQDLLDAAREDQQILRAELEQRSLGGSDIDSQNGARNSFLSEMVLKRRSPSPLFANSPVSPTLVNSSPGNSTVPYFATQQHSAPLQNALSNSTASSLASNERDTASDSGSGLAAPFRPTAAYGLGLTTRRKRVGPRPLSLACTPKASSSSRRPRSADMSGLYNHIETKSDTQSPILDTIQDTSPVAATRKSALSQHTLEDPAVIALSLPGSPGTKEWQRAAALDNLTGRSRPHSHSVSRTCDTGTQTEVEEPSMPSSSQVPSVHKRLEDLRTESVRSRTTTEETSEELEMRRSEASTPDHRLILTQHIDMSNPQSRTAALLTLVDHSRRLLNRLKTADVASLEARLKKQNLPGEVSLLAKNTIRDLLEEIENLREIFRKVLEQEKQSAAENNTQSQVNRRDFVSLVKLLRDILSELGRLRSIVNRVQIEPSLAYKMAELDASPAYDDSVQTQSGARGLLAPFSRFFTAAVADTTKTKVPAKEGLAVPKVIASKAVASDTVNVEFGSGVAKQAVLHNITDSSHQSSSQKPELSNTLKRKTTQAALNGIFAGGRSSQRHDWLSASTARHNTGAPTGRQLASGLNRNSVLSATANAVIDTFSSLPGEEAQPNLLERQLRPRGLSDSSIRSTYIAQANPIKIAPVQTATTSAISDADLEASLGASRIGTNRLLKSPSRNGTPNASQASTPAASTPSRPVAMKQQAGNNYFNVASLPFSYVGSFADSRIRQNMER